MGSLQGLRTAYRAHEPTRRDRGHGLTPKVKTLASPPHRPARWCNGSTADSGSVCHGSNPCRAASPQIHFTAEPPTLTPARGTERGCGRRPSRSVWLRRSTSEPVDALAVGAPHTAALRLPTCVKCIGLFLFSPASPAFCGKGSRWSSLAPCQDL